MPGKQLYGDLHCSCCPLSSVKQGERSGTKLTHLYTEGRQQGGGERGGGEGQGRGNSGEAKLGEQAVRCGGAAGLQNGVLSRVGWWSQKCCNRPIFCNLL